VGSHPANSDGFLKAIKVHTATSFGGEVKLSVPCRKILRNVKDPLRYDRDTDRQNSRTFLAKFLTDSLLGVSASTRAENW
jgi:hypothetical protein